MRGRCCGKTCPPARLLITALGLTIISMFPQGYHHSVLNVAHNVFQRLINDSYTMRYPAVGEEVTSAKLASLWSATVSSWHIGALIGAINAFWIADRCGRKMTLTLLTGSFHLVGGTFMILSIHFQYFELLILGRLVSGMATGTICIVLRLFIGECSPDRHRGTLNCLAGLIVSIAVLVAMILGLPQALGEDTAMKTQLLLGFCLPFNILQVAVFPLISETPKFLYLTKNDKQKATVSVAHYHSSTSNPEEVFEELEKERELAGVRLTFCKALRLKSVRLPLLLAIAAGICDTSTGIDVADSYSAGIFTELGLPSWEAKICSVGMNFANLIGAAVSVLIIDRFPRCKLLLATLMVCLIANIGTATLGGVAKFHGPKLDIAIAAAVLLSMLQCAYGAGPGAILEPLFAEVSPHRIRAVAGSMSKVSNCAAKWFYLFIFPIIDEYIGALAFLIHTIPMIGCIVYFFFCLPETRKQSVADILDHMLMMDRGHGSKEESTRGEALSSTTSSGTGSDEKLGKAQETKVIPKAETTKVNPVGEESGESSEAAESTVPDTGAMFDGSVLLHPPPL